MLILQTASDDREGLIRPNASVPEHVYRTLRWHHGCLEEGPGLHYRITAAGRAQVALSETMERMLRKAS
jgi:hypothetical protein